MAEMKAAMAGASRAAQADARLKASLKHHPGGDAGRLQAAIDGYWEAAELLEAALASEAIKDKVKAVLRCVPLRNPCRDVFSLQAWCVCTGLLEQHQVHCGTWAF